MQTATDMSTFEIVAEKDTPASFPSGYFTEMRHAARNTDWHSVITKADRIISAAGSVVVALSALYFAPFLISILSR
jgi:hypothetical protein